jgi:hypothetical protein
MNLCRTIALAALAFAAAPAFAESVPEPHATIIAQSVAAYPGPCACPWSTKKDGRKCGKASAYSKPGGKRLICFAEDVTAEDLAAFQPEAKP